MIHFFTKLIKSDEIINQLFPNLWVFIAHVVSTAILLIFLKKLVYNPFCKAIYARKNKIREKLQNASDKQIKASIYKKHAAELLSKAKNEANLIILSARNEAENRKNQILEIAKIEASKLSEQARKEIIKDKEQSRDDIRRQIIDIAFVIAKKLLTEKKINIEKDKELIESFIDSLE